MYIVVFLSMGVCMAMLCAGFKINVGRTLYDFRNVMFLAGIIFLSVYFIDFAIVATYEVLAQNESIKYLNTISFFKQVSKGFIYESLPILLSMTIAVGISNIALLRHEGKRLKNIVGVLVCLSFLIAIVGVNLATAYLKNDSHEWYRILIKTVIPFAIAVICYFECVLVGVLIMGWLAAKQIPQYDKDFIIILGCSISKKGGLLPLLKGRTNRAIRYAWEQEIACGRKVCFVPSGGQGADEIMSEGSAMALYLESHAAEADEVFPEKESTNTYENFKFSKRIIEKQNKDAKVAFATTNYHVFRSGLLARKAGFEDIEAISSKTKWYFWPNGFAREIVGIMVMTWKIHLVAILVMLGVAIGGFMK